MSGPGPLLQCKHIRQLLICRISDKVAACSYHSNHECRQLILGDYNFMIFERKTVEVVLRIFFFLVFFTELLNQVQVTVIIYSLTAPLIKHVITSENYWRS